MANIKQLVRLAEGWNTRELHDIAASKGGIGKLGRLAIYGAKRRKTQAKKTRHGR